MPVLSVYCDLAWIGNGLLGGWLELHIWPTYLQREMLGRVGRLRGWGGDIKWQYSHLQSGSLNGRRLDWSDWGFVEPLSWKTSSKVFGRVMVLYSHCFSLCLFIHDMLCSIFIPAAFHTRQYIFWKFSLQSVLLAVHAELASDTFLTPQSVPYRRLRRYRDLTGVAPHLHAISPSHVAHRICTETSKATTTAGQTSKPETSQRIAFTP